MEEIIKLSAIAQLLLVNICTCGRVSIEELSKIFGHSLPVLRKRMRFLEKREMIVAFNIGKQCTGKQKTSYYKLYAIHFNYIEHMTKYLMHFGSAHNGSVSSLGRDENTEARVFFVVETDKYERDPEKRCLFKNGKPMDTKENIKKEMGAWLRGKRAVGKSIHVPDGCTEDEIAEAKRILAQGHKREMDVLDAKYGIGQK